MNKLQSGGHQTAHLRRCGVHVQASAFAKLLSVGIWTIDEISQSLSNAREGSLAPHPQLNHHGYNSATSLKSIRIRGTGYALPYSLPEEQRCRSSPTPDVPMH